MRRLFSSFPRGWPGVGLLLIRTVAGVSVGFEGLEIFQTGQPLVLGAVAIADGACLTAGLWTPIAGFLAVAVAAWGVLFQHDHPYPGILLAAMAAAVALVGPGSLSIDAWLFGWKKIEFEE